MYKHYLKRFLDLLVSLIGIILLLPLIFLIIALILLINRYCPFFLQPRSGINKRIFKIIKFRTMTKITDENGKLLPDSQRITRFGKIIRTSSLDEIPQLINVLIGDMSLVGPRPLLIDYLPLYNERQLRRHEVRPGMTGWAQVNGRNSITWKEKFEFDIYYVENLSFMLDMKIILLTLLKMLKREGINSPNVTTMERFTGS